jgi:uncharacterized membrane protein (DUF2068 family)
VAVFEAVKGVIGMLVAFGLVSLALGNTQDLATRMVKWLRLDPNGSVARYFIEVVSDSPPRLWLLVAIALAYVALRFAEAYGLWRARRWAEWIAVASFALWLPIEIFEIAREATPFKVLFFLLNLAIVIFLSWVLWTGKRAGQVVPTAS